ncbi:rhamnulokinase [Prolixibacteraceae bacterium JC049]|nr:rhamnulokinase [Prolixibacteraceae bacterium JC049]
MDGYHFLAFDLGASSGRAMLGTLQNKQIELKEIHRFQNKMMQVNGHHHWNIYSIFEELKTALKKCIHTHKIQPLSVAVDTWGVDFGLINEEGDIVGIPFAYRDHRTDNAMEQFFEEHMPSKELYAKTGIQFMQFNSLFQVYSMVKSQSSQLKIAKNLLFTPCLLSYLFSGVRKNEYSIASTSQMLQPATSNWDGDLVNKLGISEEFMGEVVMPGTVLGNIRKEICEEIGCDPIPVVAVGAHDTASAIASVPATEGNWAYLSSGTWSLMGIETEQPIINQATFDAAFTNEGGVDGTIRFLKNITGLWLIQESRKMWLDRGEDYSFPELVKMAAEAQPFKSFINPDAADFMNPANMLEAIDAYLVKTNQQSLDTPGEYARVIFESLAMKYRKTMEQIEELSDKKIDVLHIIGGGSNNKLLNQFAANALGINVVAGPDEATATGNLLMQARALGHLESLKEIRQVIINSFEPETFIPENTTEWNAAYERYSVLDK